MRWTVNVEQVDDETQEVTVSVGQPVGTDWFVWLDLDLVDGELLVVRVRYEPFGGPAPFTSATLRQVGLGEMYRTVRDDLRTGRAGAVIPAEWMAASTAALPRPGGAGRSDVEYLRWAVRYVEAMKVAPRRPVAYLDEKHPEGGGTEAIRAYLNKARTRGLLTRSPDGKGGGELTPEAKKLLRSTPQLLEEV